MLMRTIKIVLSLARAAMRLSATTRRSAAVLALAMFSGLAINATDYYLAGSFNGWNTGDSNYLMYLNKGAQGDEYCIDVSLPLNTTLKVVSPNGNGWTYYPDGVNNDFTIGDAGIYTIKFRPNADGDNWYYGYISCEKVGGENASGIKVQVSAEGYATYYNKNFNVWLEEGKDVKARIVTGVASGKLKYETIAGNGIDGGNGSYMVPKGTAVMLHANEFYTDDGKYVKLWLSDPNGRDSNPYLAENTTLLSENHLHGSDAPTTTTGGDKYYKLSYNSDGQKIGWYWDQASGAAFTSGTHKVWLALTTAEAGSSMSRGFFDLSGSDETTGISTMRIENSDNWYSIDGRRLVGKPSHRGVYINNGKKLIIK